MKYLEHFWSLAVTQLWEYSDLSVRLLLFLYCCCPNKNFKCLYKIKTSRKMLSFCGRVHRELSSLRSWVTLMLTSVCLKSKSVLVLCWLLLLFFYASVQTFAWEEETQCLQKPYYSIPSSIWSMNYLNSHCVSFCLG